MAQNSECLGGSQEVFANEGPLGSGFMGLGFWGLGFSVLVFRATVYFECFGALFCAFF